VRRYRSCAERFGPLQELSQVCPLNSKRYFRILAIGWADADTDMPVTGHGRPGCLGIGYGFPCRRLPSRRHGNADDFLAGAGALNNTKERIAQVTMAQRTNITTSARSRFPPIEDRPSVG
jgi:hypothetical protein